MRRALPVAEKDGTRVEVPIGAPYLLVNGKRVEMDTTAQIVDTRTYLPIRPVMEAFGAYVTWDNANRLVVIKTGSNLLRVHFLDVGQGDCILIDCGETEVLIDGGNNGAGDEVVSYLTPYIDGKLDYLIATHPDADHVGGLDAVLEAFEVGEVIDSGRKSDTDTYKDYWAAFRPRAAPSPTGRIGSSPQLSGRPVHPGDRQRLGGQQRLQRRGAAHLR